MESNPASPVIGTALDDKERRIFEGVPDHIAGLEPAATDLAQRWPDSTTGQSNLFKRLHSDVSRAIALRRMEPEGRDSR